MEDFTFDVEADRKLNRELEGTRFPSEQDDAHPQSLTSDVHGADPEASANAARELAIEEASPVVDPGEIARLKKIVGDQGNELGELRRQTAEKAALEARLAQLEQERQTAQQPAPGQYDMFADVPEDQRFMSPMERRAASQAFQQLAMAAQQEIQKAREDSQYFAAKTASGVDSALEAELVREHPFLGSLHGVQKAEAIAQIAKYRKSAQGAPTQAADEAARAAARTASHVESPSGTSAGADASLEPATERLLRQARAGRMSAKDLESAMRKAGIPRYDSNGLRY